MATNKSCFVWFIASISCLLFVANIAMSQEAAPQKSDATQIKVLSLSNAPAEDLLVVIDTIFGEERFRLAADKRTNTVIVKGRPDVLAAVEAVLLRLDETPKPNQKSKPKPNQQPKPIPKPKPKRTVQPKTAAKKRSGQPRDVVEVHSEVRGTTAIRSLIPAGAQVTKGDLLVQLDDSKFVAGAETLRHEIEILKAEIMMAQQQGRVPDANDVHVLETAVNLAQLRREHYEAERKLELSAAEGEIAIASAALKFAQSQQERLEQLAESGQASSVDAQEADLEVTKAKVAYEMAMAQKKLLVDHIGPLRFAELDLAAQEEKLNLIRTHREAEAEKTQTKTRLQMLKMQLRLKSDELERLETQIEKCTILAPANGTVRYPGPGGKTSAAKQGATVREGQRLVLLVK